MCNEFYEKLIVNLIEKTSAISSYENKKEAAEELKNFIDMYYHEFDKLKNDINFCKCELNFDV